MSASSTLCPQCRLDHCHDCHEPQCPGREGFLPAACFRPVRQLLADLHTYETLILSLDEYLTDPTAYEDRLLTVEVSQLAQAIRARSIPTTSSKPIPCA